MLLTILFYHLLLHLSYCVDLYFLIPAVIAQIFNPIVELAIPIETPTKEAKAEIETSPVIVEVTLKKLSI